MAGVYEKLAPYNKAPAPKDDKDLYRYLEEELRKLKLANDSMQKLLAQITKDYPKL